MTTVSNGIIYRTFWHNSGFTGEATNSFAAQGISSLTGVDADNADLVLGFAGFGTSVVGGARAVAARGADDAAGGAAGALPQVTLNRIAGSKFEREVLDALGHVGATKNTIARTTTLSDGSIVSTIVDASGRNVGGFLEIKNVLELSFSPQIRAQLRIARETGTPLNIVVSPRTQRVTKALRDRVERAGGNIHVFDPATGTIKPFGK